MSKFSIAIALVLTGATYVNAAEFNNEMDQALMSQLGIRDMQILTDDAGSEIRGAGLSEYGLDLSDLLRDVRVILPYLKYYGGDDYGKGHGKKGHGKKRHGKKGHHKKHHKHGKGHGHGHGHGHGGKGHGGKGGGGYGGGKGHGGKGHGGRNPKTGGMKPRMRMTR